MTKAEILEAINATIAPNGQKGITAESLANILAEIVNATPEGGSGSGSGALVVYVAPQLTEDVVPALSEEQLANNAAVYAKVAELHNNNQQMPLIIADASAALSIATPAKVSYCFVAQSLGFPMEENEVDCLVIETTMGGFLVAPDGSVSCVA